MATVSSRQQAKHQPHRCAGVAAVEDFRRLLESIEADTFNGDDRPGFDRTDGNTHQTQAGRCADWIFRGEETLDGCCALRDGSEQQGAVGNGFVSRHRHPAME